MKKFILFALLISSSFCYSQQWVWAKQANSTTGAQTSKKITCSDSDHVYIIGSNQAQATFGSSLLDSGSFVAKFNSAGTALWGLHLDGDVVDVRTDIAGNIHLLANFMGTVNVGGNIFNSAARAFYLAKYTGGGSLVWVKELGSQAAAQASSLDVDAQSNIYVTGYYTDSLTLGAQTLRDSSSRCNTNFFLAKFTSSGNIAWATDGPANSSSAVDNYCEGTCVKLTKSGQPIVIGQSTDWGGGPNVFILKYSSSGLMLQNQLPGGGDWSVWSQLDFTLDDSSNIFHSWNSDTHYDYWPQLVKYDSLVNWKWGTHVGGQGYYPGYELDQSPVTDAQGSVYLAGEIINIYGDSLQVCNQWLKTKGGTDVLIGKFDRNGNCSWFLSAGGSNDDGVYGVNDPAINKLSLCADKHGGFYITGVYNISASSGRYTDTISFGSNELVNNGTWQQIFVAKFSESTTTHVKNESSPVLTIYPNPSKGEFAVQGPASGYAIKVSGVLGTILFEGHASTASLKVNLAGTAPGIYLVEINTGTVTVVKKIVIE